MSTEKKTDRRRKNAAGSAGRRTGRPVNAKHRGSSGRDRSRAESSGGRQRNGRGMTRQERQKQLMTHILIAAAVLAIAVIVVIVCVRVSNRPEKSTESAAVTADASNTVQPGASAETPEMTQAETAEEDPGTVQAGAGAEESGRDTHDTAAGQETAAAGTARAGAAQTESAAAESEEDASGSVMAEQSLVEKLSVEAKKNLETEKARLEKEEEERKRQEEEEAKKAEVKDRDELSELPVDELVEYLRNKEVPEELIGFMEEYPEAREFVTDYLYQPDPPLSKDISGEVVKGQFPHFLQWDERWGYEDYGGSFFAVAGCGPTAMSVVYSGLTGKSDMNPYKMSQWAEDQGYYIVGEGTSWEMMWSGANSLGLYWWEVDFDEMSIRSALQMGCPIIAAMSPGGDFTNFGHFIVMTDIDDEGNITIRDSNSIERTERTWTWDELMWQTAAMWAYNYVDEEYY